MPTEDKKNLVVSKFVFEYRSTYTLSFTFFPNHRDFLLFLFFFFFCLLGTLIASSAADCLKRVSSGKEIDFLSVRRWNGRLVWKWHVFNLLYLADSRRGACLPTRHPFRSFLTFLNVNEVSSSSSFSLHSARTPLFV